MSENEVEARARTVLSDATGLSICDLSAERDDQRVLQGSAIRAMLAFRLEALEEAGKVMRESIVDQARRLKRIPLDTESPAQFERRVRTAAIRALSTPAEKDNGQ